jgi:hypothetical protein
MRAATLVLLAFGLCDAIAAEPHKSETYKCRDRAGKITYSNSTCESQGLKSAGPVRDRTTVIPGAARPSEKPRAEPARNRSRAAPPAERPESNGDSRVTDVEEPMPVDDAEPRPKGAVVAPVNPLIQRLLR